mmetsp:Transcript_1908/g.6838  ORF Transcript_1908/g.6838 Transcript_1908/m.6838 type:complete len:284 (-) Transcript_1908:11-862(-)
MVHGPPTSRQGCTCTSCGRSLVPRRRLLHSVHELLCGRGVNGGRLPVQDVHHIDLRRGLGRGRRGLLLGGIRSLRKVVGDLVEVVQLVVLGSALGPRHDELSLQASTAEEAFGVAVGKRGRHTALFSFLLAQLDICCAFSGTAHRAGSKSHGGTQLHVLGEEHFDRLVGVEDYYLVALLHAEVEATAAASEADAYRQAPLLTSAWLGDHHTGATTRASEHANLELGKAGCSGAVEDNDPEDDGVTTSWPRRTAATTLSGECRSARGGGRAGHEGAVWHASPCT